MDNKVVRKLIDAVRAKPSGLFFVKNLEPHSLNRIADLAKTPIIGIFASSDKQLHIEIKGAYGRLSDMRQLEANLLRIKGSKTVSRADNVGDIIMGYQDVLTHILYGEASLVKSYPVLVDTNIFCTPLCANGATFSIGLENV